MATFTPFLAVSAVAVAAGNAPVIDPLRAAEATLVEQMGVVCQTGHGVVHLPDLAGLLRDVNHQTQAFFSHTFTDDEKMRSPFGGCYEVGGEMTDGKADPRSGCYQFDLPYTGTHGSHLWNQTQPDFGKVADLQPNVQAYRRILGVVTQRMAQGLSMHLGLNITFLQDKYLTPEPYGQVLLSKYLAQQAPVPSLDLGEWGIGAHRDYGFFAFIFQPDVGGLQVQNPAGGWVNIPPEADRVAFVAGETLELLTAGYCKAAPHRVVRPMVGDRFAITAFINPSLQAIIREGEACQNGACTRAATADECSLPDDLAEVARKTPFFWEDYEVFTYRRMFAHSYTDANYHSLEFVPRAVAPVQ